MFAKTYGATTLGIDGRIIDVEVDASFGLPGFELVGLPDTSVKESKERVRTAIRNSGFQLRQERVTVNLAPADGGGTARRLWTGAGGVGGACALFRRALTRWELPPRERRSADGDYGAGAGAKGLLCCRQECG